MNEVNTKCYLLTPLEEMTISKPPENRSEAETILNKIKDAPNGEYCFNIFPDDNLMVCLFKFIKFEYSDNFYLLSASGFKSINFSLSDFESYVQGLTELFNIGEKLKLCIKGDNQTGEAEECGFIVEVHARDKIVATIFIYVHDSRDCSLGNPVRVSDHHSHVYLELSSIYSALLFINIFTYKLTGENTIHQVTIPCQEMLGNRVDFIK